MPVLLHYLYGHYLSNLEISSNPANAVQSILHALHAGNVSRLTAVLITQYYECLDTGHNMGMVVWLCSIPKFAPQGGIQQISGDTFQRAKNTIQTAVIVSSYFPA